MIKDIQVAPAGFKGLGVFAKREFISGSNTCPDYITLSFFALSEEIQIEYLPFAPKFTQDEYQRNR